jgi:4-alpha-glucanotransferase
MLAILPLQDYLSLKPELCLADPEKERINVPAISPFYWKFRMKPTLESLINDDITEYIHALVRECGRK